MNADKTRRRAVSVALVGLLASGTVQAVISPPLNLVALHPVAWIPAFMIFWRLRGRRAFLAGWLVGLSANLAIFYWLVHTLRSFTDLPAALGVGALILFAAGTGLYAGVFAWGFPAVRERCGGAWPFGAAAWFTACEFLNPQLFPYYQGVAWYQVSEIFLVTAVTGVSGITFLVVLVNALAVQLVEALREAGSGRFSSFIRNAAIAGVLIAAAVGYAAVRERRIAAAEQRATPRRIALVQSNNDLARRQALQRTGIEAVPRDLVGLSEQTLARHGEVDVVVWPETALMRDPREPRNRTVLEFARRHGVEIWTGGYASVQRQGRRGVTNSAWRIDRRGAVDRRYDKVIRVPFGEYVPFAGLFPALRRIDGTDEIVPGDGPDAFDTDCGRIVFLICYEAIHPGFVRRGIDRDPELLVNLTYDGWYGDTSEPSQHLMLSAIQSAQFGIPMIRATTTGISTFIDARGLIRARTSLGRREALVSDVRPLRVDSPYRRIGDLFAWSTVLASAGLLLRRRRSA